MYVHVLVRLCFSIYLCIYLSSLAYELIKLQYKRLTIVKLVVRNKARDQMVIADGCHCRSAGGAPGSFRRDVDHIKSMWSVCHTVASCRGTNEYMIARNTMHEASTRRNVCMCIPS